MSKLLLLGATGLIGSSVYSWLGRSHDVMRLGRSAECELVGDLSDPGSMNTLDLVGYDAVIHCAGVTDEDLRSSPAEAFIQSTVGMNALVDKAIAGNVGRFIYISTSHVYGEQAGTINEHSRSNPLSQYAIAHYAAEQTLRRNASSFEGVNVLRPNAVFGVPVQIEKFERWSLIPYSFPLEAVYDQRIVLRSSGEQRRNFVSTNDIARYVGTLLELSKGSSFEVVNAIGKDTMSVYDFGLMCAAIYQKLTGKECVVDRPEIRSQFTDEGFLYDSNFKFSLDHDDIGSATTALIERIIQDDSNGKRYST